jgi:hypothetical protein
MNRVTFALVDDRARFASPLSMMPLSETKWWLILRIRRNNTVMRWKQALFIAFAMACRFLAAQSMRRLRSKIADKRAPVLVVRSSLSVGPLIPSNLFGTLAGLSKARL